MTIAAGSEKKNLGGAARLPLTVTRIVHLWENDRSDDNVCRLTTGTRRADLVTDPRESTVIG